MPRNLRINDVWFEDWLHTFPTSLMFTRSCDECGRRVVQRWDTQNGSYCLDCMRASYYRGMPRYRLPSDDAQARGQ